jgi:transcriptional regulator with XRE-family HTH domain
MRKYSQAELELLNIQIGCVLRLARLKQNISQHDLGLRLESNSTMIGRIERFANISGWDKVFALSQELEVDFCSLFILKTKVDLLSIVEESLSYEDKLTEKKKAYYDNLKIFIVNKFDTTETYS